MINIIQNPRFKMRQSTQISIRYDETVLDFESLTALPTNLVEASMKRKIEFFAGRVCAEEAIEKMTGKKVSVPANADRSPVWPSGISGSISHSKGFATAVIADSLRVSGVGVDVEKLFLDSQVNSLGRMFTCPVEWLLNKNHRMSMAEFATLIFSSKESIFKCFYPFIKSYFGFKDVMISAIDQEEKTFSFTFLKNLGDFKKGFQGNGTYDIADGLVHTLVEYSVHRKFGESGSMA